MKAFLLAFLLLVGVSAKTQSILLTYSTFERTVHSLEGYKALMVSDKNEAYEALLSDAEGNRYLLTIKDFGLCDPYQHGGRKILITEREAFLFESETFITLSVPLAEFMACLNITSSANSAGEKLTVLAMKLPFLAQQPGSASWPDLIPADCRMPGKLLWARQDPTSTEGFVFKIVAEIESTYETFSWFASLPCGCTDRNDFVECNSFVVFWQDGRFSEMAQKAIPGQRLKFTYYFR
ncbi:MAG TPA: hypothetical protein PKE03_11230 [Bacteroidales bacterium]|nr:hypothetical protein [Bacteroidales bacterium]